MLSKWGGQDSIPARGRGRGGYRGRGGGGSGNGSGRGRPLNLIASYRPGNDESGNSNLNKQRSRVMTNPLADGDDGPQNNNDDDDMMAEDNTAFRIEELRAQDELEEAMGFFRFTEGPAKLGWLVNMVPTSLYEGPNSLPRDAVDLFFLEDDGGTFKVTIAYEPYFFIACKPGTMADVEDFLTKQFSHVIHSLARVQKEDLSLPNHLSGLTRTVLKLTFLNTQNLMTVRKVILQAYFRNKTTLDQESVYQNMDELVDPNDPMSARPSGKKLSQRDALECIIDIREYDIMYYVRAAIDCDFRVGLWYHVKPGMFGKISITREESKVNRADPVVLAFDIETTKLPLKFPDVAIDSIMMISYMIDGQGYLITNQEIVSSEIEDFEYTPKPEYEGPFSIFNEANEEAVLRRFFEHIRLAKPTVFATYNGDFFDWPFVYGRAKVYGIDMSKEIGFSVTTNGEYKSRHAIHMDAFKWVKRDSYLPQGSQGLKAVTKYKLGYDPDELDPEDMTRLASEQPQVLAQYSVSDAVATYYLYMKYVHPFIFSLCNIIPMNPDDVLRRGSGTLCEHLLMVQGYKANVLMPNKHTDSTGKLFEGHLLDSETYEGGHVEALEAGVFRSDLPAEFQLESSAFQTLIDEVDQALQFSIVVEGKRNVEDVMNYDEIRDQIVEKLEYLRDHSELKSLPKIYHLDVAAMYPNIILTNRLQPDAMVKESDCATCDFNEGPDSICQRTMEWKWRGQYYPAKRSEYNMIRNQLGRETFPNKFGGNPVSFQDLRKSEQDEKIRQRVEEYSKKVYAKKYMQRVIEKKSVVCQRENPFYINTVRSFRDRRYEYKGLLKSAKKKIDKAAADGDAIALAEARKLSVVYDSLQLAHKCILNSFYGYVMRKGARWYSMEMAGIVCYTGSKIIQLASSRVEKIGRPLELDTDGIWCILPNEFPENFVLKLNDGTTHFVSYPCSMLNHLVHAEFTNDQYQDLNEPALKDGCREYDVRSENSIFFEVDGPYKAMILPASTEEDKLLKKRYAVFNDDGTLAELKGFEVKRRGELKLIKNFQSAIFSVFLEGSTTADCYGAVANVANQWLDVLFSKGSDLSDEELCDLISENRSMSKSLQEYGSQKSTSITTARRLAEFLGESMVKDRGLACKFIISEKPTGIPVSERAVPVSIFQAEESVKRHFLRKWLRDNSFVDINIRDVIDWQYYLERFGSVIQKLITIPAAMQGVSNPVPRIKHPDWLQKKIIAKRDKGKQHLLTNMFVNLPKGSTAHDASHTSKPKDLDDIEDILGDDDEAGSKPTPKVTKVPKSIKRSADFDDDADNSKSMPHPEDDYVGWLAFQKRKWKRQREQRARDKALGIATATKIDSVKNYFQQQTRSILLKPWQVLQILETDVPGEFTVWALIDGGLHNIKLQVPRIFYVNTRNFQQDFATGNDVITVERAQKGLPRSHQAMHLFQLSMPEYVYRENSEVFASLFNHPDVEGVYETQVPLLFRSLLSVGCVASVVESRVNSGRGLSDGFKLSDLAHSNMSQTPYLKDGSLHFLYLFHAGRGNRYIFGLFSSATEDVTLAFVDPARNRSAIPNVSNIYSEKWRERSQKQPGLGTQYFQSSAPQSQHSGTQEEGSTQHSAGGFGYQQELNFSSSVVRNEREAITVINQALRDYQTLRKGPTLLIVQSPKSYKMLQVDGMSLVADFPVVTCTSHKKDNALPPLGWQLPIIRRMFSHFFNVNSYIRERLEVSRYADVPVGNLESDYPIFLADIFFARRLCRASSVLWFSHSHRPDLGGREEDDFNAELDELVNPEMNFPGTYFNTCVELNIGNLAFNTIMQSSYILEIEGIAGDGMAGVTFLDDTTEASKAKKILTASSLNSSNHDSINPRTFKILRDMIHEWQYQYQARKDRLAEMMLLHLYRWLTSSIARMYDPAIFLMVHTMMKKLFMQMLGEFKKIGSTVIYASFDKLVISSCKTMLPQTVNYIRYAIQALSQKPLYNRITLVPEKYWDHLVWMDNHNFGGVACSDEELVRHKGVGNVQVDGESLVIEMRWNIMEYLPPALQNHFKLLVGEYVYEVHREKTSRRNKLAANSMSDSLNDENEVSKADDPLKMDKFLRALVAKYFKRKLLALVPTIERRIHPGLPTEGEESYLFPDLPGSHLHMKNPALEFIKTLTAIFELDVSLEKEVRELKAELLKLIGITEFSKETKFVNPCEPFKLSHVICEYCNMTTDIDLTRDPNLLPLSALEAARAAPEKENIPNGHEEDDDMEGDMDDDLEDELEEENDGYDSLDDFIVDDENIAPIRQRKMKPKPKAKPKRAKAKANTIVDANTSEQEIRDWLCPVCGTEYDRLSIEQKLIDIVTKRLVLWQLQDLKCKKCGLVRAENLSEYCQCKNPFVTVQSRAEFMRKMKIFANIARFHQMPMLKETIDWVMSMA